jgi:2-hydroxychromene-2-carboxylate isomerase
MRRGPRLFFSFRSPFSWIAIEQMRRRLPDLHPRMELIPYWEPDARTSEALAARGAAIHYVPMSKAKHLYILQDTKRLVDALGLRMTWPVDVNPWWEPSHLGWLAARRAGRAWDYYRVIVAARWEWGENISDPAVIARAASAAGLNGDSIAAAIDDPDLRAEGVACLFEAYEDDIFGVPYFRVGRHRFWGVDRLDAFLRALAENDPAASPGPIVLDAPEPRLDVPADVRERVGCYDSDSPGGCG